MTTFVEVRVIGREDNLLIQRHSFKARQGADRYMAELEGSGYYGTIVEADDLPLVDLCAEEGE